MNRDQIAKDLGRHLQHEIGVVLARHIRSAELVLEGPALSIMLIEAAVSMTLTASTTAAASARDEAREEIFDFTLEAIGRMALNDRARSLGKIAAARGEQVSA